MTVTYRVQSKDIKYSKIQIIHFVISFSTSSVALLGKERTGHNIYHKYWKAKIKGVGSGEQGLGGISNTTQFANNKSPFLYLH